MLSCPVRGCQLPLTRIDRRLVCSNNHSFDFARSGYVNLLQPQERKSKQPGDAALAVAARRRLHDHGITKPILKAITGFSQVKAEDVVLDAGCGEGFYLGSMAEETGCTGVGADISTPAIGAAARRFPACSWYVTNADRTLPFEPESFSLILSITGRMNAAEFHRVVKKDGRLLVALPSSQDLIELRGTGRDRTPYALETFKNHFHLTSRQTVTTMADLAPSVVSDVLVAIYRPIQTKPPEAMQLTFSLDLLLFHRR
jgi:23S rRNA (guanine745-N1)-methyltransferase